jgi:hypothetical protein
MLTEFVAYVANNIYIKCDICSVKTHNFF